MHSHKQYITNLYYKNVKTFWILDFRSKISKDIPLRIIFNFQEIEIILYDIQ